MCKKLITNLQPFWKKFQKTVWGDFFDLHCIFNLCSVLCPWNWSVTSVNHLSCIQWGAGNRQAQISGTSSTGAYRAGTGTARFTQICKTLCKKRRWNITEGHAAAGMRWIGPDRTVLMDKKDSRSASYKDSDRQWTITRTDGMTGTDRQTHTDTHTHIGRALYVELNGGIKHPVPDRVIKPSFVIFGIRALWRSALSVRVPGCQKLQMTAL